jgi:ATP-dependent Lon protease
MLIHKRKENLMDANRLNQEMRVIPLTQTVLFPESNAELRISPDLGRQIKKQMDNGDGLAVALSAKEGFDENHVDTDKLFSIGTLIALNSLAAKRGHHILYAKVYLKGCH